jgi:aminoglycoside phosphotransferase family enzyme/predicted kinase
MTGSTIDVAETHVSWLILTEDRVYKIKKPVRFPFIDLRERIARERACQAEVDLNRRLSPDVYLGVGTFVEPGGPTEPVVVMRRLPSERSLGFLLAGADPALPMRLNEIAHRMAAFHEQAQRGQLVERDCTPKAVHRLWRRNLAELEAVAELLLAEEIDQTRRLGDRYLAGREDLFASRIEQGRAVDGHGDLLAADVFCLDDGPRLLDCLEFDDSLRHVDVLLDLASLAVDIERLGRPDLARHLLRKYEEAAGDRWPTSLEHFYMAYRALVRAKVACLDAGGGDADAAEPAAGATLLSLAREHLQAGAVRLLLVGGLPGTGKSTLATAASEATGWTLLRSDFVRKDLASEELATPSTGDYGTGLYQPEHVDTVYLELLRRAEPRLRRGHTVLLDATWAQRSWREAARNLAARTGSDLIELRCQIPQAVADRRLAGRARDAVDPSEATPAVAHAMANVFEDWPECTIVDTALPVTDALRTVLRHIGYPARLLIAPESGPQ